MDLKLLIESCSDLEIWVSGGSQIIMLMSFCMWPTDLNFSYILEDSKSQIFGFTTYSDQCFIRFTHESQQLTLFSGIIIYVYIFFFHLGHMRQK